MFKKKLFTAQLIFSSLFILFGFSLSAQAEILGENEPDNYVSVAAYTNQENVTGDDVVRLAIEQSIYPKWHTYWLNPGDSGLATSVEWDLPAGYSVSELEWPTPKKIPYGELTNYGYEDTATLLQNLSVPGNVGTDPITLHGKVNVLVCHDICIPETHDVSITLNSDISYNLSKIQAAELNLPTLLNQEARYHEKENNFILSILPDEITDLSFIVPQNWGLIDNNAEATMEKTKDGFDIIQKRGERVLSEINEFPFVLVSKQDNKSYHIVATPNPDITVAPASLTKDFNSASADTNATTATETASKSNISFGKAIIFALLGGLVLNLMPCVFPVLSMKALSLVQLGDKEEGKAKLYGLSYTAGILLSFAIIAGILIGLKAAGAQIGWGFQLQNPIVISLLAYLVFVIGLSLYGFVELTGRFTSAGQNLANKSGNKGAFFTGVLATLVATPCTAPFMGAAMGYALTQGAFTSMIVFLTLGFGLALPYLALCYIPTLRTKLPKPGAWMETFRQFLSFPMFLTAAYLIWVLSQQAGTASVLIILSAMVALVFAIWLWRVIPKQGVMKLISLALLISSLLFVIIAPLMLTSQTTVSTGTTSESIKEVFSQEKLDTLLEGDEAIFTEMTAAWCITCKINERVAIKKQSVQNLFVEKNIRYLQGDWTKKNAEITQYLSTFNRQGVPLYVYYGARDNVSGQRPEPILLPQLLTPNIIKTVIQ